jgi:ribosomal protein L27
LLGEIGAHGAKPARHNDDDRGARDRYHDGDDTGACRLDDRLYALSDGFVGYRHMTEAGADRAPA